LALLDRSVPHDAARLLHRAVIIALLEGAAMTVAYTAMTVAYTAMTVAYYIMTGKTFRGLNLRDPFDEGLSIDGLAMIWRVKPASSAGSPASRC
jgi:hypothetical protein